MEREQRPGKLILRGRRGLALGGIGRHRLPAMLGRFDRRTRGQPAAACRIFLVLALYSAAPASYDILPASRGFRIVIPGSAWSSADGVVLCKPEVSMILF
jgi:hypothetical protein